MKESERNRTLIEFEGDSGGPLLVVIGAIHGNELAGLKALELVGKMLEVEPVTNPDFYFHGKMIGIVGNWPAIDRKVRFIEDDLNRIWYADRISKIRGMHPSERSIEENELLEILNTIHFHIEHYNPTELILLDLHTTSSGGGIFAIPTRDPKSLFIAQNLHAPVILEMLDGISGTTLHYFTHSNFSSLRTTAVAFEAGQHEEERSVNRWIAAIISCLRSIGCVNQSDVETIHDEVLQLYSERLPKISKLLYRHEISNGDGFSMIKGFKNFDFIEKGTLLANDNTGPIYAKESGRLLMPLYQDQGSEGFFIISTTKNETLIADAASVNLS